MADREILIKMMDPMLIRIYEIKDIEEIKFTDLAPSSMGDKINVLPSLFVMYDGGKHLNLCSKDKYFDVLVKKVFQVYNMEKDRVVVDPVFDPFGMNKEIKIDEKTKRILESGELTKIDETYEFYDKKKSYDNSLLFQSDVIKHLLPMILYHLKQIFDCTDRTITFDNTLIQGYRNNYGLNYKYDGIDDMLLINFVSSNNTDSFLKIRSRDRNFSPLEMSIRFNANDIDVTTYFKDYGLLVSNSYEAKKNNVVVNTFKVYKDDQPIIFKNIAMDKVENPLPNVTSIDSKDDVQWYKLPWNALYGVGHKVQNLSDIDEIVMAHTKYLAIFGEEFTMREYAAKEYRRKKTFEANSNRVVMAEVKKRIHGIILDQKEGIYLLETYFGEVMRNSGYYDAYLEDKYYYHVIQSKDGLIGLCRDGLVSISQDDNIIRSADLLVTDDIKKKMEMR